MEIIRSDKSRREDVTEIKEVGTPVPNAEAVFSTGMDAKKKVKDDIRQTLSSGKFSSEDTNNEDSSGTGGGYLNNFGIPGFNGVFFDPVALELSLNYGKELILMVTLRTILQQAANAQLAAGIVTAQVQAYAQIAAGEEQAASSRAEAAASIAGGVTGMLGVTGGLKDEALNNHTFLTSQCENENLAGRLNAIPAQEARPGGAVDLNDVSEQNTQAVKDFAEAYRTKYNENYASIKEDLQNGYAQRVSDSLDGVKLGLNNGSEYNESVLNERAARSAAEQTWSDLKETDSYDAFKQALERDPKVSTDFYKSLGTTEGGVNDMQYQAVRSAAAAKNNEAAQSFFTQFGSQDSGKLFAEQIAGPNSNIAARYAQKAAYQDTQIKKASELRQMMTSTLQAFATGAGKQAGAANQIQQQKDAASATMQGQIVTEENQQGGTFTGNLSQILQSFVDMIKAMSDNEKTVTAAVTQATAA